MRRPMDIEAIPDPEIYADCIADCETGHLPEARRDTAVGDNGAALGRYQIHRDFVRECNRIIGRPFYHDEDRTDPIKARDMTIIHATYYWRCLRKHERSLTNVARIHNGGWSRWHTAATKTYASRFDAELVRRINGR